LAIWGWSWIRSPDAQEREGYRHYAALHKQWREVIHHGTQWRVDMPDATTLRRVL
jgi:alpha-galactosidase